MHLEMEACPFLCRIAALILLTLGGKKGHDPLEIETGRGWSPLGALARLALNVGF